MLIALAASFLITASPPPADPAGAWEEITVLVRERFRDPKINGLDWGEVGRETAAAIEQHPERGAAIIQGALDLLEDGHTHYFTPRERERDFIACFSPTRVS